MLAGSIDAPCSLLVVAVACTAARCHEVLDLVLVPLKATSAAVRWVRRLPLRIIWSKVSPLCWGRGRNLLNMIHVQCEGRLEAILAQLFSLGMGGKEGRKARECRPAIAGKLFAQRGQKRGNKRTAVRDRGTSRFGTARFSTVAGKRNNIIVEQHTAAATPLLLTAAAVALRCSTIVHI